MKNRREDAILCGLIFIIVFTIYLLWTYFMGIPPRQLESSLIVSFIAAGISTPFLVHTVKQKWELEELRRLIEEKE